MKLKKEEKNTWRSRMRQRALGFTSMPNSDRPRPERERERERARGGVGKNIIMQARYVNILPAYIYR